MPKTGYLGRDPIGLLEGIWCPSLYIHHKERKRKINSGGNRTESKDENNLCVEPS